MQSMLIPKGVCANIERLVRQFIWGCANGQPKMSLVWDSICQPRFRGGLGLRHLSDQNMDFLMNIGFSLVSKSNALWVRVFRSKELVNSNGSWNLELFRVWLHDEVINRIISIPPPYPNSGSDKVIWARSTSSALSIRSAF
ncbi:(+)-neomenthol dehydrogenase-like [Gossypium australe]|uniref:(+)-neomenthol dehydrogenase-like n=1 Tax=Gossypium australe TaxID=47621 RepID=A0A5B6UXJ0_9ROSI|nr:(+)-neomenthol dehydrogenase-like [Gossypium australe]